MHGTYIHNTLYLCQSWPQTGSPHSQVCKLSPAPLGHLRVHIGQWCSWHALKHITLPPTYIYPPIQKLILPCAQMHKQHSTSQWVCVYVSCPVRIDDHTGRHTAIVWCQGGFLLAKVVYTWRKLNTQPLKLKVSFPCPAQHFITCKQATLHRLSRAWDKDNKGLFTTYDHPSLSPMGWNCWSTGKQNDSFPPGQKG